MEVLVNGRPIAEYDTGDMTYIEALKGREYSIRLTNHTGRRIAVALSVDGLNSIDAKTTTVRDATKWILAPWQSIVIDGWQTSSGTARHFFFSTERGSYGAWLGRTSNLGIISAAVFRERRYQPQPYYQNGGPDDLRLRDQSGPPASAPERGDSLSGRSAVMEPNALGDPAATGIGREVGHDVRRVRFDAEPNPVTVMNLRYEFRDALVKLGVLEEDCDEDVLARRERARGFEDMDYAPDPYRIRGHDRR